MSASPRAPEGAKSGIPFIAHYPHFGGKKGERQHKARRRLFILERHLFFEGPWLIDSPSLTSFLN